MKLNMEVVLTKEEMCAIVEAHVKTCGDVGALTGARRVVAVEARAVDPEADDDNTEEFVVTFEAPE